MFGNGEKNENYQMLEQRRESASQCEILGEYLEKQLRVVQKFEKWVGSEKEEKGHKECKQKGQAWHELEVRTKWG